MRGVVEPVIDCDQDGVPDFLADRNGDGNEDADEMPWLSVNTGDLAILCPTDGARDLSGVIRIRVSLGGDASSVLSIRPLIDGRFPVGAYGVIHPQNSLEEIEIDTRYLEDGQHVLMLAYAEQGTDRQRVNFSAPVNFSTANPIRQPSPERKAALALQMELAAQASLPQYTLHFFNSTYPKAYDPLAALASSRQGTVPAGGRISYTETLANLNLPGGDVCPKIYPVTELAADGLASGEAGANATITQPTRWTPESGPGIGWWAAAYSDDIVDYDNGDGTRIADKYSYNINPLTLAGYDLWYHGVKLNSGWRLSGALSSAGTQPTEVATPRTPCPNCPQTWPLRLLPPAHGGDQDLLLDYLRNPQMRNFYGLGHGYFGLGFLGIDVARYSSLIHHRYRFAFIDGCQTSRGGDLPLAFGATDYEAAHPAYPLADWSVLAPDIN
jgi:hypothetical protein